MNFIPVSKAVLGGSGISMKSFVIELPVGLSRLVGPWYTEISICGIGNEFDRRLGWGDGATVSSLISRNL